MPQPAAAQGEFSHDREPASCRRHTAHRRARTHRLRADSGALRFTAVLRGCRVLDRPDCLDRPQPVRPPAAGCTANDRRPGHQVINVTAASGTQLTATAAKFICGPDVPDDGYYQATGPASS